MNKLIAYICYMRAFICTQCCAQVEASLNLLFQIKSDITANKNPLPIFIDKQDFISQK